MLPGIISALVCMIALKCADALTLQPSLIYFLWFTLLLKHIALQGYRDILNIKLHCFKNIREGKNWKLASTLQADWVLSVKTAEVSLLLLIPFIAKRTP